MQTRAPDRTSTNALTGVASAFLGLYMMSVDAVIGIYLRARAHTHTHTHARTHSDEGRVGSVSKGRVEGGLRRAETDSYFSSASSTSVSTRTGASLSFACTRVCVHANTYVCVCACV